MAEVQLQGKVVLVTGANRGIGKAIVEVFLQHGVSKIYAGVRNLDSARRCFAHDDDRVIPLYMDLCDTASIQEASTKSQDVDIVINNAGLLTRARALNDTAISNLQSEMDVNVYGLIRMAQAYVPILKKLKKNNRQGVFVQINSTGSFRVGIPDVATYSSSKAAAYSITHSLKQEAPEVRFLSVHPGPIATEMIKNASSELAKTAEPPSKVAEEIIIALSTEDIFHVFPDKLSQNLGKVLETYTTIVIEQNKRYG